MTRKRRLRELIAARGWERIGEPEWRAILAEIPEVTPADLESAEVAMEAPWCGVRQHTFDELEASLKAFSAVYEAREDLRRFCRETVIRAKDRAKWASRSQRVAEEKRRVKAEMTEWMLVWLGDPAVFPAWVELRRRRG